MTRNVGDKYTREGRTYEIVDRKWRYRLKSSESAYPFHIDDSNDWWDDATQVKPWFELNKVYAYRGGEAVYTVKALWEEGGVRYAAGTWRYSTGGGVGVWTRDTSEAAGRAFDRFTVVTP